VPVPGLDPFGNEILRRMRVSMDEETLKEIARVTGGRYFHADDPESLREIYEEIDELEKTKTEVDRYVDYRELYPYLVLPALALLLLGVALENTYLLTIP
jgi:Ca-activated chloride channel family protein